MEHDTTDGAPVMLATALISGAVSTMAAGAALAAGVGPLRAFLLWMFGGSAVMVGLAAAIARRNEAVAIGREP